MKTKHEALNCIVFITVLTAIIRFVLWPKGWNKPPIANTLTSSTRRNVRKIWATISFLRVYPLSAFFIASIGEVSNSPICIHWYIRHIMMKLIRNMGMSPSKSPTNVVSSAVGVSCTRNSVSMAILKRSNVTLAMSRQLVLYVLWTFIFMNT